jgi:Uma2 family endonuclease
MITSLTALPTLALNFEPSRLKRLAVKDYHRMSELGILDPGERTELIAGQIVLMVAKGTPHVTSLHLLANDLRDQLKNNALVRPKAPFN